MDVNAGDIGAVVGGYRLERFLGGGGMGTVYLGTHRLLGRKAAVKILADHLASDSTFVSRFFHEARVVNDAQHPNIVDIIDFVRTEDPPRVAYIMEYIDGPALSEVVSPHRLAPIQALNITRHIGRALTAVHALDVVHRDLKPANVLLANPLDSTFEAERSAKILDFGIAKVADPDSHHRTATGAALGTPAYMAPEQLAGHVVSFATDVYALAEIFFEMLSGRPAFDGDNLVILKMKVIDGGTTDLELPADVPCSKEVLELTQACLSFDPKTRPPLPEFMGVLDGLVPQFAASALPCGRRVTPSRGLAAVRREDQPEHTSRDTIIPLTGKAAQRWAGAGGLLLILAMAIVALVVRTEPPESTVAEVVNSAYAVGMSNAVAPIPARVRLETEPRGAAVRAADGRFLGKTPCEVDIPERSTRVHIQLEGYVERQIDLTHPPMVRRVELAAIPPEPEAPATPAIETVSVTKPRPPDREPSPRGPPAGEKSEERVAPIGKREVPKW